MKASKKECMWEKRKSSTISKSGNDGTVFLNARARIPQQFAKITAVICRRLCSYRILVLVCLYIYIDTQIPIATHRICTYVRVVTHRGPDSWYTHAHIHTHTHNQAWYYCERACSKQFPICLPLSILSVPSSFRSLLSWATSSVSILSPRPNPLNASAGVHVHPNRLYLHLIASSKVLLRHV